MKVYAETPKKLERLTKGLSEKQLRMAPARGKWSIAFLISHLCVAEWAAGFRWSDAVARYDQLIDETLNGRGVA